MKEKKKRWYEVMGIAEFGKRCDDPWEGKVLLQNPVLRVSP